MKKINQNVFTPVKIPKPTEQGMAGFDNARENIDPHIRTKAVSTKEITLSDGAGAGFVQNDANGVLSGGHGGVGGGDVSAAINLTDGKIVQGDGGVKGVKTSTATVAQIAANVTHSSSDGTDHAYIDQDVTVDSSPTFQNTKLTSATELTISGGIVTKTQSVHTIDTEGDIANDELDTINGGNDGDFIYIRANNDARTITLKDSTGNLNLWCGDLELDENNKYLILIYDGVTSKWTVVGGAGLKLVKDTAYGVGWNGDTKVAPSKNAVYDKVELLDTSIAVKLPLAGGTITQTSTTGNSLKVQRNLAAASTDSPVVEVIQDNAGDDQSALKIQNDGTGYGLTVSKGNVGLGTSAPATNLHIDYGAASSGVAVYVNGGTSDVNGAILIDNDLGGDGLIRANLGVYNQSMGANNFYRNLSLGSTAGPVMGIIQANASDDQPVLKIQQSAVDINVVDVSACTDKGTTHTTLAGSMKVKMPNGAAGYINFYT